MRDIFSDLYNKVLSFFVNQNTHDETKGMAMSRLKTVLMQDRVGFSERAMQMLKEELVSTISKYMEIDEELFDLEINAGDNSTVLNLAIPVTRAKTDEEIDEAIKEQSIKTQAKAQEIVEELEELIKERAAVVAGVQGEETQEETPEEEEKEEETHEEEETQEVLKEAETSAEEETKEDKKAKVKEN